MSQTTRTFIAVEVPGGLGHKLSRLQSLLAVDIANARWVEPSQFHVTLAFLGEVAFTDLNELCKAVAAAASGVPPLELRLERLGVFPDAQRPRVLWVGLTGPGLEPLVALQERLAAAADRAGYPPDEMKFHPHVTIARLKTGKGPAADLTPQLNHFRTWAAGSFEAREVVVFSSTLTPEGPAYAPLGRVPLKGADAPAPRDSRPGKPKPHS